METLELSLLLLGIVLVSAVLDQMLTRVSLPLVQIGVGAVAALLIGGPFEFNVDSELFLMLFIAPLLFDESRKVSKRALVKNLPSILSLAIGLVIVTTLVVGFTLNAIAPSVPLAAAFALGAALGPTDAVAVSSLAGSVNLSKRQDALLSGEALINDASGIVSFQFAVAAITTGAFSLAEATQSFVVTFAGGLALGVVLGIVALLLLRLARRVGLDSTVFFVTFEMLTPFAVFMVAESQGVSGILAVVAAGLLMTLFPQPPTLSSAQINLVSDSVWKVFSFVLNGVVFVILGMLLPQVIMPTWQGSTNLGVLIGVIAAVTALVLGVRFVWILGMEARANRRTDAPQQRPERHAVRERGHSRSERRTDLVQSQNKPVRTLSEAAKDALVTTLAGPKGAVTLTIVLTLPAVSPTGVMFPWRDELLFVASGVILCTLLLANFVLPLLAPQASDEAEEQDLVRVQTAVFHRVQKELAKRSAAACLQGKEESLSAEIVRRKYDLRLAELSDDFDCRVRFGRRRRWRRALHIWRMRAAGERDIERQVGHEERPAGRKRMSPEEVDRLRAQISEQEAEAFRLELDSIHDLHREGLITADQAREMREKVYVQQMGLVESI